MSEPATVLPSTALDAVKYVRDAASHLATVEQQRADALARVREAVMAARVMKVPWEIIGSELGVSRQAASERFGGDVRAHLVTAWHALDLLLAGVARRRRFKGRRIQLLRELETEGAVPPELVARAVQLFQARSAAVHDPSFVMEAEEADHLSEVVTPLAGMLWMLEAKER